MKCADCRWQKTVFSALVTWAELEKTGSPDFSWQVFSAVCRLHLRRLAT
jgi:hypothetical protein